MIYLRALAGILFFCVVSWSLSSDRRRFPWRVATLGLALQLALAGLILGTDAGRRVFEGLAAGFERLIGMAQPGAELVFGPLASYERMSAVFGPEGGFVFAFAGKGLAAILFFAALMGVLYHIGVMQVLIWVLARAMSVTMGVSGAEAMAMAANVFVGQTEAPLVVKPYVSRMTMSELNALMTGGFATIAGTVLAIYMGFVGEALAPHLIAASAMSAPAAFMIAKIIRPESELPATGGRIELRIERTAGNVIEAAANGALDGMKLWLNIIAMLIAFMALVNLADWPLGAVGRALDVDGGLSLARLFGWVFAPVAWLMGVEGWADSQVVGSLLGTKIVINELVAYSQMHALLAGGEAHPVFASERSAAIASYALCGFANFASIGVQLGGLGPLAPERRGDFARLAFKAMLGGAFASWTTATVAGIFL